MKRYGNLLDKIVAFDNLLLAARKAQRGKQERSSVGHFVFHLEAEILTLQEELLADAYRMRPYRTFVIYEPKPRSICAAAFRDRVVQHAICHVLDPIFEACLITDTYACRRGKGTHAALRRAQALACRLPYVLKCDIRKYFESVDHAVLKTLLHSKIKDKKLLLLLEHIIDHPIAGNVTGKGLPIGNLSSQYFANLYLGVLDHFLRDELRIKGYVRYMDDFLVFADNKPLLHSTLATVRTFLQQLLALDLRDEVIRIAPVTQGILFLGFRIFPGMIRVDGKKWQRFRRRVRALEEQYVHGMIDEENLAQAVASMVSHIGHANSLALLQEFFAGSLSFG